MEKGSKKRVKLQENGEPGQARQNGQNGQNEDMDSDDNYAEVDARRQHPRRFNQNPTTFFLSSSCEQDIMSPLQEESGCDEDEDEEEGREEEEDGFDSDESLVDSDSDSDDKGASLTAHPSLSDANQRL